MGDEEGLLGYFEDDCEGAEPTAARDAFVLARGEPLLATLRAIRVAQSAEPVTARLMGGRVVWVEDTVVGGAR